MTNAYLGTLSLEESRQILMSLREACSGDFRTRALPSNNYQMAVRKSLALHYMEAGKHPVKEIAIMLGYNELAHSRALLNDGPAKLPPTTFLCYSILRFENYIYGKEIIFKVFYFAPNFKLEPETRN